jgi:hypothetical protein
VKGVPVIPAVSSAFQVAWKLSATTAKVQVVA